MKNFSFKALITVALTLFFTHQSFANKQVINLQFHLVEDLAMTQKGVSMQNWITAEMISDTVMPEINKIWSVADIEWRLAGVDNVATNPNGRQEAIDYILKSDRDANGKGDPQRIKKIYSILPLNAENQNAINIYVIPYLGITSQGNTSPAQKRVLIGQWSDKFSRGSLPPQKVWLTENGAPKRGSFSRTVAHELGHAVGLKHPSKSEFLDNLLMGGSSKIGNELTAEEIEIAQKKAAKLFF